MTAKEFAKRYEGKICLLAVELSLSVEVHVKDGREKFGRTDLLVTPVAGSGEKWVSSDRVELKKR